MASELKKRSLLSFILALFGTLKKLLGVELLGAILQLDSVCRLLLNMYIGRRTDEARRLSRLMCQMRCRSICIRLACRFWLLTGLKTERACGLTGPA